MMIGGVLRGTAVAAATTAAAASDFNGKSMDRVAEMESHGRDRAADWNMRPDRGIPTDCTDE